MKNSGFSKNSHFRQIPLGLDRVFYSFDISGHHGTPLGHHGRTLLTEGDQTPIQS